MHPTQPTQPTYQSNMPTPEAPPQIAATTQELELAIGTLRNCVDALEQRLAPFTLGGPKPVASARAAEQARPPMSVLRSSLVQSIDVINAIIERVNILRSLID